MPKITPLNPSTPKIQTTQSKFYILLLFKSSDSHPLFCNEIIITLKEIVVSQLHSNALILLHNPLEHQHQALTTFVNFNAKIRGGKKGRTQGVMLMNSD